MSPLDGGKCALTEPGHTKSGVDSSETGEIWAVFVPELKYESVC